MHKIHVAYTPSEQAIIVTSEYLRINYTADYISELTGLNKLKSKRVLYWLGKLYDESVGISINTINKTAQGVESGLL